MTISSTLLEFRAKWQLPKSVRPRARRPTLDEFSMTISSAVVDLKAKWHTLRDFERAEAILPIIRAGLSRRGLADALNISERGIRRLLLMLEADPIDQDLFRQGKISQNELIRRVNGTSTQPPGFSHLRRFEAAASEPQFGHDPIDVCHEILNWLAVDDSRFPNVALILRLAITKLNQKTETGSLIPIRDHAGASVKEIILHCRPNPNQFVVDVWWHGEWLLNWVFRLISIPDLCRDALKGALNRVLASEPSPELW